MILLISSALDMYVVLARRFVSFGRAGGSVKNRSLILTAASSTASLGSVMGVEGASESLVLASSLATPRLSPLDRGLDIGWCDFGDRGGSFRDAFFASRGIKVLGSEESAVGMSWCWWAVNPAKAEKE